MDRSLHHDLPVKDYHFNEDGTQIISIDQGDNIYVWDVKDGKKLTQLSLEIDEGGYIITPIDAIIYGEDLRSEFDFFRSEDNSYVGRWTESEESYIITSRFIDEEEYMPVDSGGKVTFYNIAAGTSEELAKGRG